MGNGMRRAGSLGLVAAFAAAWLSGGARAANVTTYHYDNLRTGWNQAETVLTPATVGSSAFGLLAQVSLDEQVDGQPLFLSGEQIAGGTHDVVYVVTENDSIYALDAVTGATLASQSLGTPVPISALPGGCNNNSNNIGINSTPVIDQTAGVIYVVSYTYENSNQVFRIHKLDLITLQDVIPSVVISAAAPLANGKTENFRAASQRQRAALIETGGNVYAGFASFCDIGADTSRGWVLGWNAATLAPLPSGELVDRKPNSPDAFFLSSVWMSGYGIASDDQGSLFFVTGNTDYSGRAYNRVTNLAESVVRLSTDLTTVQDFFTPANHGSLDEGDADFGAAGVLLLPDQGGGSPPMAVAAGKSDSLYLLNRNDLGEVGGHKAILGSYTNNGCWCGQSYYQGSDGTGRVVTSTGSNVMVWTVKTSPKPGLSLESTGPNLNSGQDPGFLTTVSSNGTQAGTAVIWALPHPGNTTIGLTAMDPANKAAVIFSGDAGSWPFAGNSNANLVPMVANGHVYVASYGQLSIFGLSQDRPHVAFRQTPAPAPFVFTGTRHDLYGVVVAVDGSSLSLRDRGGRIVKVDLSAARRAGNMAEPSLGRASLVRGDYDAAGVFDAHYVLHAKGGPAQWGPDR